MKTSEVKAGQLKEENVRKKLFSCSAGRHEINLANSLQNLPHSSFAAL